MPDDRGKYPSPASLKKRAYLIGLPVGTVACLVAWILEEPSGLASFDHFAMPLLAIWLLTLSLAFWYQKGAWRSLEVAFFLSVSLFFLTRLSFLLVYGYHEEHATVALAGFGYWFPVLYALAFLVFGARDGAKISLLSFAIAVAVGIFHLATRAVAGGPLVELYALSQIYISDAILILLFVTFARLTESHSGRAAEMEHLAHTDALTRVNNRRRLEALLDEEIARAERYERSFSVLLLDIDRFKEVNDEHGHDVGDEVLRQLANLLRMDIRTVDHVGRWGGEEFLIILPEIKLEEARDLALRLQASIKHHRFPAGEVTASFGVAEFRPGDMTELLVKRADKALYKAKAEGRNVVITAVEEGVLRPRAY